MVAWKNRANQKKIRVVGGKYGCSDWEAQQKRHATWYNHINDQSPPHSFHPILISIIHQFLVN